MIIFQGLCICGSGSTDQDSYVSCVSMRYRSPSHCQHSSGYLQANNDRTVTAVGKFVKRAERSFIELGAEQCHATHGFAHRKSTMGSTP